MGAQQLQMHGQLQSARDTTQTGRQYRSRTPGAHISRGFRVQGIPGLAMMASSYSITTSDILAANSHGPNSSSLEILLLDSGTNKEYKSASNYQAARRLCNKGPCGGILSSLSPYNADPDAGCAPNYPKGGLEKVIKTVYQKYHLTSLIRKIHCPTSLFPQPGGGAVSLP